VVVSLTKLLVALRPRRTCRRRPCKAEPSSQSCPETKTGKQKRKAILRCRRHRNWLTYNYVEGKLPRARRSTAILAVGPTGILPVVSSIQVNRYQI